MGGGATLSLPKGRLGGELRPSAPAPEDPEFIAAVRAGDHAAVSRALEMCLPSLGQMVSRRFGLSREECEDVLQEVQVAFLAAAPRFRGECTLHSYLMQIACHKCTDYLRRRERSGAHSHTGGQRQAAARNDDALEIAVNKAALEEAISCLTPRERRLVELFYTEARSYREIAAELEIAIGAVGGLKAAALLKLRKALEVVPRGDGNA